MKRLAKVMLIFSWVVLTLLSGAGEVRAEVVPAPDADPVLKESLDNLNLEELEKFKNHIDGELSSYLSGKSLVQWLGDFVRGEWKLDAGEIVKNLLHYFFREVTANSGLLGKLLILGVVTALLVNLQSAFEGEGVARISYLVCFLALLAIALGSFRYVLEIGYGTIESMTDFMVGILPQMMILVAGMGSINASAMMFPLMTVATSTFANVIQHVVFPLIILSAVLGLLDVASDTIKVQRLGKLVSSLVVLLLGFFMTVFVGLLSLKTVYGGAMDQVALRATQFVTGYFPVVGGFLSDALEFAVGYIAILKNALSIFGLIIVFGICIFPLLKIGAIILIYKISAALIEPMGDTRTAQALEVMGHHLTLVLGAVAAVALMFFIMFTIVAGVANHGALL